MKTTNNTAAVVTSAQTNNQNITQIKRVSQREIAEHVGCCEKTVCRVFNNEPGVSEELKVRIVNAATELGYAPRHTYYKGNFATHEEEVAHMLQLRAEGYSNAEIARKTGRDHKTVLNNIGRQPEAITAMSHDVARLMQARREEMRKAYVLQQELDRHNAMVESVDALNARIASMENTLKSLRDEQKQKVEEVTRNANRIRPMVVTAGITMREISQIH